MLSSQAETERGGSPAQQRVQILRTEYWDKVRDIDPENLVFLDETGIMHWAGSPPILD